MKALKLWISPSWPVAAALLLATSVQGCTCNPRSDHLLVTRGCPPAPPLSEEHFQIALNAPLNCFARVTGMFTTPFKRAGILGWRDYGIEVVAEGEVEQAEYSTDGFLTVDLQLLALTLDDQPVSLSQPRFLRAEICARAITLSRAEQPRIGDRVRISGRLKWDGDGFLEVHPQHRTDVEVLAYGEPVRR